MLLLGSLWVVTPTGASSRAVASSFNNIKRCMHVSLILCPKNYLHVISLSLSSTSHCANNLILNIPYSVAMSYTNASPAGGAQIPTLLKQNSQEFSFSSEIQNFNF